MLAPGKFCLSQDTGTGTKLEIRPDKEDVMRLKHLVVASLMAGALAVAGATTLAQPPEQDPACQECVDKYHDDVGICKETEKGRARRECVLDAEVEALKCLDDCPIGRNRP